MGLLLRVERGSRMEAATRIDSRHDGRVCALVGLMGGKANPCN
jgi:hypothetical protein